MLHALRRPRTWAGLAVVGGVSVAVWVSRRGSGRRHECPMGFTDVPSRTVVLSKLAAADQHNPFDVLVIGGGATGSGAALDATTRGLRVACIEKEDWSAGTSSRSTKLIHGGVRYLEKAFTNLDPGQLSLVFDALHERKTFLDRAPHLTKPLPIITPCYEWWELPYYYAGLKAYDLLAIGRRLYPAYYLSAHEALRQFPMMNDSLLGAVVYYDGQMNDSRMNVSLAITAASLGATMANHMSVTGLLKDSNGKVNGVEARDNLTGHTVKVYAKAVINACGPFVDHICKMDDPNHMDLIVPAQGSHIILPDFYSPANMGLIVPKTKDGRVVFMLPWLGHTIAGTTDERVELTDRPHARKEEEMFILGALSDYLRVDVRPSDVLASWAGIRPLARDPSKNDTQSLSRDHVIVESASGLVTIAGGKWTTYHKMALDVVNHAVGSAGLGYAGKSKAEFLKVVGGEGWDEAMFTRLTQNYVRKKTARGRSSIAAMNTDIALHLSETYGTRAFRVAELAQDGWGKRLAHGHPYLEAEVVFAARHEYAQTVVDIIARRTRLAFIDTVAAERACERVADLLAEELSWDSNRKSAELKDAKAFLETMRICESLHTRPERE